MELSVNERLYQAVCCCDILSVNKLLAQGACFNVTSSTGKTAIGAAASLGDVEILQLLLDNASSRMSPKESSRMKWASPASYSSSDYRNMRDNEQYVCQGDSEDPHSCHYMMSSMNCDNFNYPAAMSSSMSMQAQPYTMCSFSIDYSNQNQGYYVVIHGDNSPSDLSPEWAGTAGGSEGLEWDEEVGIEALPTTEDETWAALYRWYAQMLEQTEGLIGDSETSHIRTERRERIIPADPPDACQRTAAHYAAEQGHCGALRLLLQSGSKVDTMDREGLAPLHLAVSNGHAGVTHILLAAGTNPNRLTSGPEFLSPLHIAASKGHTHIIEILMSAGVSLEIKDGVERTALLLAIEHKRTNAIAMLVQAGANVNIEDIRGTTPLCEAVWEGDTEVVEMLLSAGARPPPHHYLLHHAVLHRKDDIARLLLESGVCVDLRDDNGDTSLLIAARSGQASLAKILLIHGASVDYPNSLTGSTALHEAVECINDFSIFHEVFTYLQDYLVNLNVISLTGGDTPLCRAIILHRDKAAELLIKQGADVNLCCRQHCIIDNLSLALKQENMFLARLLVLAGAPPPLEWGRTPRPLSHIARLKLRACLPPGPLFRSVQALPLPTTLKGFLMYEDEG